MKSINFKIVLAIVLCSIVGLMINGMVNLQVASGIVRKKAVGELNQFIKRERAEFEKRLQNVDRAAVVMEGVVKSTFDVEQLESEDYIDQYINDSHELFTGIAREMELMNIYAYFNPEYYKKGQSSIADLARTGDYLKQPLWDLHRADLNSADMAWYSEAIKRGDYWANPFFWEKYKMNIVSYTRAVYLDNRLIAVVGSDLVVDEQVEYFEEELDFIKGQLFLYDSELNFIMEDELAGKSLKDISPGNYERFKSYLERGGTSGNISYEYDGVKRELYYEKLFNDWIICLSVAEDEIWQDLRWMTVLFWVLLAVVIVGSVIVAFLIAGSITGPLKSISMGMERISTGDGDLTQKLEIRVNDEVGILAGRFNRFMDKLKEIVDGARQSALSDEQIVSELQDAASSSSGAINRISTNLDSIKELLSSLNSNIFDSTASIEEVSANISSINNQVESQGAAVAQSTSSIEEMIASLNSVVQVTQRKLEAIEQLVTTVRQGGEQLRVTNETFESGIARRIGEITEMIKVINSISAQTNLLAMNASIEAAHAGESGRGFAVVAEEIRSMAETTSESARNISGIINQIVDSIKETAGSVEKTSQTFIDIDREVLEFKGAFQEIASSTSEISIGGNEILNAVSTLNQVTTHIQGGVSEIDRAALQVKAAMLDLKEISAAGLKGIHEIHEGTGYVESSIERVSRQAAELAKETEILLRELNRFKT